MGEQIKCGQKERCLINSGFSDLSGPFFDTVRGHNPFTSEKTETKERGLQGKCKKKDRSQRRKKSPFPHSRKPAAIHLASSNVPSSLTIPAACQDWHTTIHLVSKQNNGPQWQETSNRGGGHYPRYAVGLTWTKRHTKPSPVKPSTPFFAVISECLWLIGAQRGVEAVWKKNPKLKWGKFYHWRQLAKRAGGLCEEV